MTQQLCWSITVTPCGKQWRFIAKLCISPCAFPSFYLAEQSSLCFYFSLLKKLTGINPISIINHYTIHTKHNPIFSLLHNYIKHSQIKTVLMVQLNSVKMFRVHFQCRAVYSLMGEIVECNQSKNKDRMALLLKKQSSSMLWIPLYGT